MRIGPELEVTTSYLWGKYGIEIQNLVSESRQFSFLGQNFLWNKSSMWLIQITDNTEAPADPHEEQMSQTSVKVIAARSEAKSKPQQRELVGTTATIPMHERRWIDIEPSEQTLAAYDLSKKVISLLRHNQTVQREKRWSN